LFDQEKNKAVPGCFIVMLRLFLLTFFTFCYFLLLFLLLITFVSYFLLLKGVRFVTFCYFFTACNFQQLFFTGPGGPWFIFYSLWDGGGKGAP
jgi:hypothetical protein